MLRLPVAIAVVVAGVILQAGMASARPNFLIPLFTKSNGGGGMHEYAGSGLLKLWSFPSTRSRDPVIDDSASPGVQKQTNAETEGNAHLQLKQLNLVT